LASSVLQRSPVVVAAGGGKATLRRHGVVAVDPSSSGVIRVMSFSRNVKLGMMLVLASGCAVSANTGEPEGRTEQASTGVDIASAVLDIGAFIGTASGIGETLTLGAEIGLMAAGGTELKDQFALVDDLMGPDPNEAANARLAVLQGEVDGLAAQIGELRWSFTNLQQKLDGEVSTLADWSVHDTMAMVTSTARILADNAAPLGLKMTDAQRGELQTGVDLLEPQIDSLEYKVSHMPASADVNVRRFAILTWMAAMRLRMAYSVAGLPTTRDYVLARQAFLGSVNFPFEAPGTPTPGADGYVAFNAWWEPIFRAFLDPYRPIRGAADFDGDGMPDLVVHDVFSGQVSVWPVTSDLKVGIHSSNQQGGGIVLGTMDAKQWRLDTVTDVDGDGKSDLVFERLDGFVTIWHVDGMSVRRQESTRNVAPDAIGAGVFRGIDGRQTLGVAPASTSYGLLMLFDTPTPEGFAGMPIRGFDWQPRGLADFNGDGLSDILWWQPSSGRVTATLPQRDSLPTGSPIYVTEQDATMHGGPNWDIRALGDFNRDGRTDILWQSNAGELNVWFMNGLTFTDHADLTMRPYQHVTMKIPR
jgi:hypothetical protein